MADKQAYSKAVNSIFEKKNPVLLFLKSSNITKETWFPLFNLDLTLFSEIFIKWNQIKWKSEKEPNVEPQDCLQGTTHHRADSGLESKPDESTNYLRPWHNFITNTNILKVLISELQNPKKN